MSSAFSKEHQVYFRKKFRDFDTNQDGKLSYDELIDVLTILGFHATDKTIEKAVKCEGRDKSTFINYKEYMALIERLTENPYTTEELVDCFSIFDEDTSGTCSFKEFK